MINTTQTQVQKKVKRPFTIEALILMFNSIQLHIDKASGAATALDLRLRAIAQLEPKVQAALKKKKRPPYHQAKLSHLIEAILEVFPDQLSLTEQAKLQNCRQPRNKATHGSFAELMIELNGKAPSREIDRKTLKPKPLAEDDIIEGAICIERNGGLEDFSRRAKEAIEILEKKVMRSLQP